MTAVLGLLALASCGEDEPSGDSTSTPVGSSEPLTAAEQRTLTASERTIQRYCTQVALAAAGQRNPPSPAEQQRAFAAVDELGRLVASKPAAEVEAGVDAHLFLSDLAEDVEGANCDARLVQGIEAALAAIPPG